MCILLTYSGVNDAESDYSYILVSNRDEFYNRPAQNLAPWIEDPKVYGGRDLEDGCEGGTWLAVSLERYKIGVLLNLPGVKKENPKSNKNNDKQFFTKYNNKNILVMMHIRLLNHTIVVEYSQIKNIQKQIIHWFKYVLGRGKVVADFVKCEEPINVHLQNMKNYFQQCNEFVLVIVDLSQPPVTYTYSNATDKLDVWNETTLGFGNSLPENPLKKVEAAKSMMADICTRFNNIDKKAELIEELINMLKSKDQHLPDLQLETRQPNMYKELSSIFMEVPHANYGTRTHTLILITKTGHVDVIEITLQPPINLSSPHWQRTEFQFDI